MSTFWQSFQGLLGPHGFKGWKDKDLFDNKMWKEVQTGGMNPRTMRQQTTFNYQPRGLQRGGSRPGASIASTSPRRARQPLRPMPIQGRTTALRNTPQQYGVPIPLNKIRGVAEETGQYWRPKLEKLGRETGDYWGPKVDKVMDEAAQFGRGVTDDTFGFWDPMVRRDLGKLEETWNRADLVGDTKDYWTPVVKDLAPKQVWNEAQQLFQPKWEDLLKYLRRGD